MAYLKMNHRDSAPHTPRLILLGPTGCGKSVQAELLASKYGLVNGKLTQKVYEQTHLIYYPSLSCARRLFFALKIVVCRGRSSSCHVNLLLFMRLGWQVHVSFQFSKYFDFISDTFKTLSVIKVAKVKSRKKKPISFFFFVKSKKQIVLCNRSAKEVSVEW